jgi:hypothetical protein
MYSYNSRYRKSQIITDPLTGKQRISTPNYPEIPILDSDIYIEVKKTIRLYKLADDFYGDPNLQYIIMLANNMKHPWDFGDKTVLRIPRYKENVLSLLNSK